MYICTRLRTKALLYVGCSANCLSRRGSRVRVPSRPLQKPSLWGLF